MNRSVLVITLETDCPVQQHQHITRWVMSQVRAVLEQRPWLTKGEYDEIEVEWMLNRIPDHTVKGRKP